MPRITNALLYEKLIKLEVVLLGIPESKDMGMYGEFRDMVKLLKQINGMVKSDHAWIGALRWALGLLALLLIGTVTASKIMGVW